MAPRITFNVLRVLSTLLGDPYRLWYGLELAEDTALPAGTVYAILARLERQLRWVSSSLEDIDTSVEGRPKRRLYRLTGDGQIAARDAVDRAQRELDVERRQTQRRTPKAHGGVLPI